MKRDPQMRPRELAIAELEAAHEAPNINTALVHVAVALAWSNLEIADKLAQIRDRLDRK